MRVKELADIAGTTVRTVRHYHAVGLLEVPRLTGGVRDYGLDHLARLLRIRWLVDAGLSLPAIAEVLPAQGRPRQDTALEDLRATLSGLDSRLTELTAQRERVLGLIERVEAGENISPLPAAVARVYDRLAARMPSARARRALESERGILAVLAVRGLLPTGATRLAEALTPADDDMVIGLFESFTELEDAPPERVDAILDEQAAGFTTFVDRHEDLIADIVRTFPGGAPGRTATTLLLRIVRVGFPANVHQRLVDRVMREAATRPRIAEALGGQASSR
jgi:DNA-binding transcriptional MerR regulator